MLDNIQKVQEIVTQELNGYRSVGVFAKDESNKNVLLHLAMLLIGIKINTADVVYEKDNNVINYLKYDKLVFVYHEQTGIDTISCNVFHLEDFGVDVIKIVYETESNDITKQYIDLASQISIKVNKFNHLLMTGEQKADIENKTYKVMKKINNELKTYNVMSIDNCYDNNPMSTIAAIYFEVNEESKSTLLLSCANNQYDYDVKLNMYPGKDYGLETEIVYHILFKNRNEHMTCDFYNSICKGLDKFFKEK